jgi:serine/threonine-protein kinase
VGPLPGDILDGRYRLADLLGKGGLGAVYEAEHLASGRRLAVKLLHGELGEAPDVVRRFQREAKAASLLDHPNIVEVLDLGALPDGALFLVMELVRGRSIGSLLDDGALAPRRALVIARQILDGLAYAHGRGLVHRDLKPDNVMIVSAGDPGLEYELVKILDFGLVRLMGDAAAEDPEKLTRTGVVFGTPKYMSPEQALGRPADARSDLYAVGVMLFEMLTGKPPFDGRDPYALMRMHITTPAPPIAARVTPGTRWCTRPLEGVLARALAKRPEDRHRDADTMIRAVEAAMVSLPD